MGEAKRHKAATVEMKVVTPLPGDNRRVDARWLGADPLGQRAKGRDLDQGA